MIVTKLRVSFYWIFLIFIGLDSCIDPLRYDVSTGRNLVVDGMITDHPGPYTVMLYYSNPIGDEIYAPEKASGAKVIIESDAGESEILKEAEAGTYITNTIQGVVGRTYILGITLVGGEEFYSRPEKLLPVGDIDKFYYEFVQNENPRTTNYVQTTNGFNLYVDAKVLENQKHHLRWRWNGTFEILTYPQFRTITVVSRDGMTITRVPAPRPCSFDFRCGCCTCCTCWVSTLDDAVTLSNQDLNGVSVIQKQMIGFVPASRRLLYNKYQIVVDQLSLSDEIYDYWLRIRAQGTGGTDLFQTPPPSTNGNILSASSKVQHPFGIFAASSIVSDTLTIFHDDVPYFLPAVDTIAESCLLAFMRSTTKRPPNW